jgi:hypothetical protein
MCSSSFSIILCNLEYFVHYYYSLFPCSVLFSQMFTLKTFYCLLHFVHQTFWKGESDNEGSQSSLQSLESGAEAFPDNRFFTLQKRESSLDRSVASFFHLVLS